MKFPQGSVSGLSPLLTAALASILLACDMGGQTAPPPDPEPLSAEVLAPLWDAGIGFGVFLESVQARENLWNTGWSEGGISQVNQSRAKTVAGRWRLLVVAEDWCGDSAANIPYLAHLAAAMDNVELRIVDSDAGDQVLASHPTPDGRAATPTVLLLDEDGRESGCWIERPAKLQAWYQANKDSLSREDLYGRVWEYYGAAGGEDAVAEILDMMLRAEAGATVCGLP
jgi:hypothetical protein